MATGVASGAHQYFDMPISFGFRFATAPSAVTVGIDDTAGEAAAAGCPGTAADPKAAPGKVCIYEMGRGNTEDITDALIALAVPNPIDVNEAGGANARVGAYRPPFGLMNTASRIGTIVEVYSAAAGNLFSNGVWAATSP